MTPKADRLFRRILIFTPIGWYMIILHWSITDMSLKECIKEWFN